MSKREAPTLVGDLSDEALDKMLTDGWTPMQVRTLIKAYRALKQRVEHLERQLDKGAMQ
jgi:hypothetical protein